MNLYFSCLWPFHVGYHVVDGDEGVVDDLDVEAGLDGRPEDEPPDPLEAVDPDLGRQHLARRRRAHVDLPLPMMGERNPFSVTSSGGGSGLLTVFSP